MKATIKCNESTLNALTKAHKKIGQSETNGLIQKVVNTYTRASSIGAYYSDFTESELALFLEELDKRSQDVNLLPEVDFDETKKVIKHRFTGIHNVSLKNNKIIETILDNDFDYLVYGDLVYSRNMVERLVKGEDQEFKPKAI